MTSPRYDQLDITSPERLAHRLGFPLAWLREVAANHASHYTTFEKQFGQKTRRLFRVDHQLRAILINVRHLLRTVPLPPYIVGGRPGGSLRRFAEPHVAKPLLLKLDIKSFYPSVSAERVYELFHRELDCAPSVSEMLTTLTTAENHLPQGFHTSTDIGNLLIKRTAVRLAGLAKQHECDFSVWVDNLVLSGPLYIMDLEPLIRRIIEIDGGFALGECEWVPNSRAQVICGLTVNTRLRARKALREEVEAEIREVAEGRICAVCRDGDAGRLHQRLKGRIAHIGRYSRRQGRRLLHQLREAGQSVDWSCVCDRRAPRR